MIEGVEKAQGAAEGEAPAAFAAGGGDASPCNRWGLFRAASDFKSLRITTATQQLIAILGHQDHILDTHSAKSGIV